MKKILKRKPLIIREKISGEKLQKMIYTPHLVEISLGIFKEGDIFEIDSEDGNRVVRNIGNKES